MESMDSEVKSEIQAEGTGQHVVGGERGAGGGAPGADECVAGIARHAANCVDYGTRCASQCVDSGEHSPPHPLAAGAAALVDARAGGTDPGIFIEKNRAMHTFLTSWSAVALSFPIE